MSIIQRLRRIFETEGQEFVHVLYRELLNREPDQEGFREHVKFLSHGASKISVMRAILSSDECHHLLVSQRPLTYGTSSTLIDKLRQTFQKEGREFVAELYRELLNREPDSEGLEAHTSLLTSGLSKISIMEAIFWSNEGQDLLSSSLTLDLHVKNIGTMLEPTGYAKANRYLMIELNKLGIPVRFQPHHPEQVSVPLDPDTEATVSRLYHTTLSDGHIVLFNYPGEHFFRDHHYTIGFTMYELSGISSSWVEKCNQMDEIWVPSSFNQQTFTNSGVDQNKLRVMPLGVDTLTFSPDVTPLTIQGKRRYTFLSVISGFSSGFSDRRKGIDVLLPAFLEEFSESEDVCLVIKTHATSEDEVRNQQAFIDHVSHEITGKARDSIILISSGQPWTEEEMARLYRVADCYVFPTRGEGWNMTVMEAMAAGIPVITTNWSAHLDFMNDSNGYLIAVQQLVPFINNFLWAEPDKNHLRQLMRYVYSRPDEAIDKARRGTELIRTTYTWEMAARRIFRRLQEIQYGTVG